MGGVPPNMGCGMAGADVAVGSGMAVGVGPGFVVGGGLVAVGPVATTIFVGDMAVSTGEIVAVGATPGVVAASDVAVGSSPPQAAAMTRTSTSNSGTVMLNLVDQLRRIPYHLFKHLSV